MRFFIKYLESVDYKHAIEVMLWIKNNDGNTLKNELGVTLIEIYF